MADGIERSRIYHEFGSEIVRLYWEGNSVRRVSKLVGVSEWSVRNVLRYAGGAIPKPKTGVNLEARRITDLQVEQMRALAAEGFNLRGIADALGVSIRSVKRYAPEATYDRHASKLSREVLDRMGELVSEGGHSASEIARLCGVSRPTVKKYYPELPIPKAVNKVPDETVKRIGLFLEDGVPLSEIEATLGVSRSTIRKYYPPKEPIDFSHVAEVRWMMKRFEELEESYGV